MILTIKKTAQTKVDTQGNNPFYFKVPGDVLEHVYRITKDGEHFRVIKISNTRTFTHYSESIHAGVFDHDIIQISQKEFLEVLDRHVATVQLTAEKILDEGEELPLLIEK